MTPLDSRIFGMPALRRLLAVLALALAVLFSSAGVASAQNWSLADPKSDVVTFTGDDETAVPAPNRRAGDVWRTSVRHTSTTVVIRVTMQAIPTRDWMAFAQIRTPRTSFDLTQIKIGSDRGLSFTKTNGNGDEIRCRGKSSRIIGTALVFTVPRSCLGRPGSVRVGVGVAVFDNDMQIIHADDALRRGIGLAALRLSPLIRRG
ncbi:MAG TPA: hypothetical protein VM575_16455 [Nocardioides sp.]|nr:hypothetical protein [Nocardioides sp.]